jgi:hypothetical protein
MTFVSVLQGQFSILDNILLKPVPLLSGQLYICLQLILLFDGILELADIARPFDDAVNLKVLFTASEAVARLILACHL